MEGIQTDKVVLGEVDSCKVEDEKNLDMNLFVGGVVHSEETPSKG